MRKVKFGSLYRGCLMIRDGDGFRFEIEDKYTLVRTPKEEEKHIDKLYLKKLQSAAV